MRKIDFLRDKDPFRIVLLIALILSLFFNYMLYQDQQHSEFQMRLMKHNLIEDVIGYDYCGSDD